MKDFRLSSLQDDLLRCQGNLQTMTSQKEQIEEEMEEMKKVCLCPEMRCPDRENDLIETVSCKRGVLIRIISRKRGVLIGMMSCY